MAKAKNEAICAEMNNSLLEEYNAIRKELATLTRTDLAGRRKLGERFGDVLSNKAKYGDKSCVLLAGALGVQPNYIYTHARVAATWGDKEIENITTRYPCVSFSHLVHIANVPDEKDRAALIKEVQAFDLAVDAVVAKSKEKARAVSQSTAGASTSPMSVIKKSTKLCTKLMDNQEDFEGGVFDPLTDSPEDYTSDSLIEKLSELSAAFLDVEELAKGNRVKLQACIKLCQKAERDPTPDPDFDLDEDSMPIPTQRGDTEQEDSDDLSTVLSGIKKGK